MAEEGPPLSRSVRLTSTQPTKSDLLDFAAWSAQVYSNANQWLHFVGTNQFVGPGQQGAIISLPGFTEYSIEWAAPTGTVQPPATPATEVDIVFYSVWMPPSPGISGTVQSAPKPFDGQASHGPGVSTQATTTLQGVPGRRWNCATMTLSLAQAAAGPAGVVRASLIDGPSGGASVLWTVVMALTATVGDKQDIELSNLAYFGSAGAAMTLEFANAFTNGYECVTFGAYLV